MKNFPGLKIFVGIIVIAVAAVIVFGFYTAGSPNIARQEKFDRDRVNDLLSLQSALHSYYSYNKNLPVKLTDLQASSQTYVDATWLNDPQTGAPYEYTRQSTNAFELCANFNLAAPQNSGNGLPVAAVRPAVPGGMGLAAPREPAITINLHGAGRQCFPDMVYEYPPDPRSKIMIP